MPDPGALGKAMALKVPGFPSESEATTCEECRDAITRLFGKQRMSVTCLLPPAYTLVKVAPPSVERYNPLVWVPTKRVCESSLACSMSQIC